ncbi:protein disulfide-isomerase domain [Aphanomyces invadans]|uniref:Protein disulfide-isomerase domain n=1 Tax=Aphanomyces invadans TaxID=157072 RepID=A0A024TLH7_9STRA|nr:protein disulfide-isomerase domain [Aphanomyces invadans]ETV94995.1 protein disulfide-isomerase domain [Aphanomyces invadans]|eukprot:XP_008876168.1 protein disulfide-isomerase domain [Aphanomyces invadans]
MRRGAGFLFAGVVVMAMQVPELNQDVLNTHVVPAPNEVEFAKLLAEKDVVFAKFYAPWCGHCKSLGPTWKQLSAAFARMDNAAVVHIDCDKHLSLCNAHGVEGFPTLKLFRGQRYEEYEGQRSVAAMSAFIVQRVDVPIDRFGTTPMAPPPSPVLNALVVVALTFLGGFTLSVYVFFFRPGRKANPPVFYSQPDNSTVRPGHGAVYKVGSFPSPQASLLEVLEGAVASHGNEHFLGRRRFDAAGHAGPYVWETYAGIYDRIRNLSAGLQHEKMIEPCPGDGRRLLCIYMKNSPEYVVAQYAAFYAGGAFCALYDTLGASSTAFILRQTQASTVVCTTSELQTIAHVKANAPTLRHIVVSDVEVKAQADMELCTHAGLQLWTAFELEQLGAKHPRPASYPNVSALSFLMYTSGTTGDPKGVEITHANILACAQGAKDRLNRGDGAVCFTPRSTHLSYLPMPHILEQIVQSVMISAKGSIGFYQGNTLKLTEDLVELRPTHFVTVPRLLNKIYDKVVHAGESAGGVKGWLFKRAMRTKLANLKRGYLSHPLYDKLIFSKIQAKLGLDRCRFVLTGSAPISDDVMSFFRILLDATIAEGYGQSECTGAATLTDHEDVVCGTVGAPMISSEIKLVSVPDMGYLVTDSVHGDGTKMPVNGRGEICFRGPTVFLGYFKAPDKTAEAIDADGWLHSGDIGIVDRKKNIFKLSQGEYVAPEKIENILVTSPYVAQPFVYGDSLHAVLVAIIVPEAQQLKQLAESLHVTGTLAELCSNPKVVEAVHQDIAAVSKKGALSGFETVRAIYLHPEHFTVENDLLTPTFKLKRNDAKKRFSHHIDAMYEKAGDLVAGKNVKQGD